MLCNTQTLQNYGTVLDPSNVLTHIVIGLAERVWLIPQYRGGDVVGLSPNIRVYRYVKGHFFGCHCKQPRSLGVLISSTAPFGACCIFRTASS